MYFQMTEQVKRRLIMELRRFWSTHPRYPDIVDHIQGKYSFKERPQYGIVLKSASANPMQLSADNFVGTVQSYVMYGRVGEYPGLSVEWVQEDSYAIQLNRGVFPSPAGVYYCEVEATSTPTPPYSTNPSYQFYVDPLLEVRAETPLKVDENHYVTMHPILEGSLRLYEMPSFIPLKEGADYTVDYTTGEITLAQPLPLRGSLSADYRYAAPSTGPWPITLNESNQDAIPGAVIAFGNRVQDKDRFAIVVSSAREPTALEYGGRYELSVDFDVLARDPFAQQEISDTTIMWLWGVARNQLSTEGIEITQVSGGGESEESYDENADDYYYNASFSVSLQADWSIHVPLNVYLRSTTTQFIGVGSLTEDAMGALSGAAANLQVLESLGVQPVIDPFFRGPMGVAARTTYQKVT